jgi:hypothetical protein
VPSNSSALLDRGTLYSSMLHFATCRDCINCQQWTSLHCTPSYRVWSQLTGNNVVLRRAGCMRNLIVTFLSGALQCTLWLLDWVVTANNEHLCIVLCHTEYEASSLAAMWCLEGHDKWGTSSRFFLLKCLAVNFMTSRSRDNCQQWTSPHCTPFYRVWSQLTGNNVVLRRAGCMRNLIVTFFSSA